MRVLVVEDDIDIGTSVARFLREAGYAVDRATTISQAEESLAVNAYDALVLDRGLPDGDAIDTLRLHRTGGATTPALFLTAFDAVKDRVEGLQAGADDYLVKPFSMDELVARVHALTRRPRTTAEPILQMERVVLDPALISATRSGRDLGLTIKEFAVLRYLLSNPNRIVTRSELIDHCWDELAEPMSNVVDVKVAQLRKKLGDPPLVYTIRGAGYLIRERA